jgi:hypothetical protein
MSHPIEVAASGVEQSFRAEPVMIMDVRQHSV